jgi:2'-5' RNA ligase
MRLFVAIDVPAGVKDELRRALARLRPLAKLQWSPVDNMHVTTKFIGEWPRERLEEMKSTLAAVGSPGPFSIDIGGLGWFPNARRPRVFWAGAHAGAPLETLAHATEEAVATMGVPVEDRPYSPHLKLARIRNPAAPDELDRLRSAAAALEGQSFGSFYPPAFYLYLSAGGQYTRLAEYSLE